MHVHKWENSEILQQIWTLNQANQNDWPMENWKNWPIKLIQIAMRVWLSLSLSLSLSEPTRKSLSTSSIFLFLLINTLLVSLLFIFMGIFFCRAEGPGPCHWPLVEWLGFGALTTRTQPHLWLGNRSPASSCTGQSHLRSLQRPCSKLRNFRKN